MKVLYIVTAHFQAYGGPYKAISDQLYHLKKYISFKLIYRTNSSFKYNLNFFATMKNYDVVHIYGLWSPFLVKAFLVAKFLKKKIIISPIGTLEPWSLKQKIIKKKLAWFFYQKKILQNADVIHATSDIESESIKKLGIKTKILVIPHGINIQSEEIKNIKKTKTILFFSRIHKKKGLLELLEAWKKTKNKNNWKLHVYGPVSDQKYFKSFLENINTLRLNKEVFYKGSIYGDEAKNVVFREAGAFILPSKSENFGISIGEALALKLPVLTTTVTPWEIINDYKAGYVFEFSIKNIKNALEEFINLSPLKKTLMGNNAKKLIKDHYLYETIIKKYHKLYKSLI